MERKLSSQFRKKTPNDRRKELQEAFSLTDEEVQYLAGNPYLSHLGDRSVESCIGTYSLPIGIAQGFLIDGEEFAVPMATEEPSVIMGASYAALLIKRGGGFQTRTNDPVTTAQVFLCRPQKESHTYIKNHIDEIREFVDKLIPGMVSRGGGFRSLEVEWSEDNTILCISIDIHVCDAMGANVANHVAEHLKPLFEQLTQGVALMGILTNSGQKRLTRASFSCPAAIFKEDVCDKIVEATRIAELFPERAVTHNKGVMNGITALVTATGNDTRAVESGIHFHAQITGRYRPLTTYRHCRETGLFTGEITLPLPLGIVGGSVSLWPPSRTALKILGVKTAQHLSRIAAAVGLAQNLAALTALVTEGIQFGHMKLHGKKQLIEKEHNDKS